MTSPYLIGDLKRDEGCKLHAYADLLSGGEPWTIGYGCTGPGIGPESVWTPAEAEDALASRVWAITMDLTQALPWFRGLSDLRQDVLVNMAYNMGLKGLVSFHHTLGAIEGGYWQAARDGMLASLWARQVPERAKRLATQMLTNVHQD